MCGVYVCGVYVCGVYVCGVCMYTRRMCPCVYPTKGIACIDS